MPISKILFNWGRLASGDSIVTLMPCNSRHILGRKNMLPEYIVKIFLLARYLIFFSFNYCYLLCVVGKDQVRKRVRNNGNKLLEIQTLEREVIPCA